MSWSMFTNCSQSKNTFIPIPGVDHTWVDVKQIAYLNYETDRNSKGEDEFKVKILLKNGVMRTIKCKDEGEALFLIHDLAEEISKVLEA